MKLEPKEKAKELVDRFVGFKLTDYKDPEMGMTLFKAKKNALICVDELLSSVPYVNNTPEQVRQRMYFMDVRQAIREL